MGRIEWAKQNDGTIAGNADFVRYIAYDGEQETWQNIHDARVAKIAAANGYTKLQPDQSVIDTDDLKMASLVIDKTAPRDIPGPYIPGLLKRLTAALDASEVK